ncbi:MAG TPA: bifunctional DNA primase/polymerase [bacterium]|nr:bifunctional DNA primase/polymerase [bacterium]
MSILPLDPLTRKTSNLDASLDYLRKGLSIFPVHAPGMDLSLLPKHIRSRVDANSPNYSERDVGKVPLVKWKPYESRLPTETEIRRWWTQWPGANIGLVTGKISRVVVVDADSPEAIALIERWAEGAAPKVETGRGRHYYFTYPEGEAVRSEDIEVESTKLEVQSDGNYVLLPPSVHRSGRAYSGDFPQAVPPPIPGRLLQALKYGQVPRRSIPQTEIDRLLRGPILDGQRHDAAKTLATHFVALGTPERVVRETLRAWAQTACAPPGDEEHIEKIIDWAFEQERVNARKETPTVPFPEEAYVGLGAEFVDLFAPHTKASRQFLLFSFLTCLGHLVADRLLMPSVDPQSPRLYTILVGPTGEGKSTAKRLAVDVFTRANTEFPNTIMHGTGSGEGIALRLSSKDGRRRKVLLAVDELSGLIEKAKAEGSILLPVLSTLYEDTDFDNATVKSGTSSVRKGYLTLLTATTPVRYETVWRAEFIRIGFTNRVWLVWDTTSDPGHATPGEVDARGLDAFVTRLQDAVLDILAAPHQTMVRMSPPARAAWESWYKSRMDGSVYTTRLDVQGWRLMMLLALCRGERARDEFVVSQDTIRRVCLLLDHQLDLRRRYDPIDADTLMAQMEQRIRRVLTVRGPLTKRELMRAVHADRVGLWIFGQALDNLSKAEEVGFDRLSKTWYLQPVTTFVTT